MSDNPFLRRLREAGVGKHGFLSEHRTAKRMGARETMYSGSKPNARGDMVLGNFLIEAKSTISGSLRLPLDWLAKITGEAERAGRVPALSVSFVSGDGRARANGRWVAVPESVFLEMCGGGVIHERGPEGGCSE